VFRNADPPSDVQIVRSVQESTTVRDMRARFAVFSTNAGVSDRKVQL
jgi:hypothetical protein